MDSVKNAKRPHNINIQDRKTLFLTGICDVESFDESSIVMLTEDSLLTVEGENLHIEKLFTDSGEVCVEGRICALYYSDKNTSAVQQTGIFGKIFGRHDG